VVLRLALVMFFLLFLAVLIWLGLYNELLMPFKALGDRVRLLSYLNYSMLVGSIPLLLGVISIIFHQLLYPKKSVAEYADRYKGISIKLTCFTVALSILAIVPRYYLGYQVDKAGYVKCSHESRTSSKSSWRIYAKRRALCKSSSGIAGG